MASRDLFDPGRAFNEAMRAFERRLVVARRRIRWQGASQFDYADDVALDPFWVSHAGSATRILECEIGQGAWMLLIQVNVYLWADTDDLSPEVSVITNADDDPVVALTATVGAPPIATSPAGQTVLYQMPFHLNRRINIDAPTTYTVDIEVGVPGLTSPSPTPTATAHGAHLIAAPF